MSNQVYKNSNKRYDLVNSGTKIYDLSGDTIANSGDYVTVENLSESVDNNIGDLITSSNGTVTFQVDGTYCISYEGLFSGESTGTFRSVRIVFVNSGEPSVTLARNLAPPASGTATSLTGSCTVRASSGSTIIIQAGQDSDANPLSFGGLESKLFITRIA